jgi:hypothetical protein
MAAFPGIRSAGNNGAANRLGKAVEKTALQGILVSSRSADDLLTAECHFRARSRLSRRWRVTMGFSNC